MTIHLLNVQYAENYEGSRKDYTHFQAKHVVHQNAQTNRKNQLA